MGKRYGAGEAVSSCCAIRPCNSSAKNEAQRDLECVTPAECLLSMDARGQMDGVQADENGCERGSRSRWQNWVGRSLFTLPPTSGVNQQWLPRSV